MSLEELMNVRVANSPGTLIPTSKFKSPVSVTTITAEDIRLTPHRNLLDLIEVYVPGCDGISPFRGASCSACAASFPTGTSSFWCW